MSAAKVTHERKLRELVEQAGFELAINIDHPGHFRIITKKDWARVADAAVTPRGFEVVFPARGVARTGSTLVDHLEQIKKEMAS